MPRSIRSLSAVACVLLACAAAGGACEPGSQADGSTDGPIVPAPGALCEVYEGLQAHCWSCHGTTLHGGSPNRLVTRADLLAPSAVDEEATEAARSLIRMHAMGTAPMPPGSNAADMTALANAMSAWIGAGSPDEACGDATVDPYEKPASCSGVQLPITQDEGDEMNPGRPCSACHEQINAEQGGDAPIFAIAGTVFPNAHELDDCVASVTSGSVVEIEDAAGKVVSLDVNAAGNFFYEEADLALPYTARVVSGDRVRAMAAPQMDGECNSCHSSAGDDDAPGRILSP